MRFIDVEEGRVLPAGTVIWIGHSDDVHQYVWGLQFTLKEPVAWKTDERASSEEIVFNPGRWFEDTVEHDLDIEYDRVISIPEGKE